MIIRLPKSFMFTTRKPKNYAYVSNNILYVHGYVHFESLMYNLSYTVNGYSTCYYCGCELFHSNRTLDHIYPRSWGGISLPNNLQPSCRKCNGAKSDMTPKQFETYRKLISEHDKHEFYQKSLKENRETIKNGSFIVPSDWITMYDSTKLIEELSFKYLEMSKMEKLERYYNKIHQYPHPIVVSSNNWLFKGKHILYHARKINQPIVPAIILENVVVLMNTS